MNRVLRIVVFLFWLELGVVLILAPWSDYWDMNYFLFQYPSLGLFLKNAYLRGAVSGLGLMDVLLAVASFRYRDYTVVNRN
jgi:hypothetical protein